MQSLDALNRLNLELTHLQRATVQTLTLVQSKALNLPPQIDADITDQANRAAGMLMSIADALRNNINAIAAQQVQTSAEQLRSATQSPTAPMSAGRQQIADIADDLAKNLLGQKIGPDKGPEFIEGVERVQAQRQQERAQSVFANELPTIAKGPTAAAAKGPTLASAQVSEPVSMHDVRARQQEERRQGLLDLLVGKNGLIARWFSSGVYPEGTGVIAPQYEVNLYQEDISQLPYERLNGWPEGFYREAATSAFQYLFKTNHIVGVIHFSRMAEQDMQLRANAVEFFFHNEKGTPRVRRPASVFDSELLENVIRDANERLAQLHGGQ